MPAKKKPLTIDKKRKLLRMVEKFDADQRSYMLGVAHGIKAATGINAAKS